jgi:choline-glycine betaine transporter
MKLTIALFILFLVVQIADVITTVRAIAAGASEGNPLIAGVMKKIGVIPSLIIVKVFVICAVGIGFYFLPYWLLSAFLGVGSAVYIAVVVNNIIVERRES